MVEALEPCMQLRCIVPSVVDIRMATHLFQTTFWIGIQIWQYSLGNIVKNLAWVHTFPSINMNIGDIAFLEEKGSESEKMCVKEYTCYVTLT